MKDGIIAKKYGRNLIVVIDGQKKTRVIITDNDKKDEQSIKNKILLYNKKNNKLIKEEILYLIDGNKAKNDNLNAEKKGLKKSIKKETKNKKVKEVIKSNSNLIEEIENSDLSEKDVERLEKLLNKSKANQKQIEQPSVTTKTPKRGEY